ncbi:hypothetical protein UY3_17470 [Chelonia mydas]|uniref:Uncharacterized protein n=1 Tax=Chelonia mydas TaxID=8469 RepID=M7AK11_CHEMY|nr:hypothetical protein UY3_17470 [Chelonia mydas]
MQKKRSPPAPEGKGASVKGPTSGPVSTLGLHRSTAEVRPPSLARDLPLTPRSIRRPQLLLGPSLPKAAPAAKEQAGHPTPCQVPDSAKAPTPEGKLVIRLPHRAVEHPQSLDRRRHTTTSIEPAQLTITAAVVSWVLLSADGAVGLLTVVIPRFRCNSALLQLGGSVPVLLGPANCRHPPLPLQLCSPADTIPWQAWSPPSSPSPLLLSALVNTLRIILEYMQNQAKRYQHEEYFDEDMDTYVPESMGSGN